MTELQLTCLGEFELVLAGEPLVGLRFAKARALVCYLAVEGRPHSRAALAGLLWSELPEDDARANLRVMLTKLRHTLPEHILTKRETVAFNRKAPYTLDVEAFLSHFCEHTELRNVRGLRDAVALYQGDFLGGFDVSGASLFDEWVMGQRERLRHLALQALHTLATYYTQQRDYLSSIDYLTRLLALDPWREDAHRQLMELLALSGQPEAALAQFEACRRVLDAALGVEPSPETLALARSIADGEIEPQLPSTVHHTVPKPPTPLLGREALLAQLVRQIGEPNVRLLTLTGPGGVGKTRLGSELAGTLQADFADGVFFVSLAPVSDSALVGPAIAQSLGLRENGREPLAKQLITYLHSRQVLLLLDNFEHLLPAAALVAELLTHAPQLKVLTTSRAPLHLRGEHEVVVAPLSFPDVHQIDQSGGDVAALASYPSMALFCERARALTADFALTTGNSRAVMQICARLDGLPLAIELAAAHSKLLSPQAIAARLDRRLHLLTHGAADLPKRHQTLRATLDWSYGLLDKTEQRLFRRLSVTVGGCSLGLAAALEGRGQADELSVLAIVESLQAKSLLQVVATGEGEPRVGMLETVREYALEKLAEVPLEMHESQERHALYFASWLTQLHPRLVCAELHARRVVEADRGNIRVAWQWLSQHDEAVKLKQMSLPLGRVFEPRPSEAVALFSEAAANLAEHQPEQRAALGYVLVLQAWLLNSLGKPKEALTRVEHGLELLRPLAEYPGICKALSVKAWNLWFYTSDPVQARALWQESLELARQHHVKSALGEPLAQLLVVELGLGSFSEIDQLARQNLPELERLGDYMQYTKALCWSGSNLSRHGYFGEGLGQLLEAVRLARSYQLESFLPVVLGDAAEASLRSGAYEQGERLAQEATTIAREKGIRYAEGRGLTCLGRFMTRRGNYQTAKQRLQESLRIARQIDDYFGMTTNLFAQAELELFCGHLGVAVSWFALVAQHPRAERHIRAEARNYLDSLKDGPSSETFDELVTYGEHLQLDVLVAKLLHSAD